MNQRPFGKQSTLHRAAACAAAITALALVSPAARAEAGHSAIVYSTGAFTPTDPTLPVNIGYGSITALPDGSSISHMGCIAAVAGGVGCSTNGQPLPVTHWYDRPFLPTTAAAQAFADYGVLKARTWRTEGPGGDSQQGDPLGTRSYFARATSEWSDDLIYTGAAPTVVTVQFTLHAKWNDLGRFAFSFGREYIGAENVRLIDGLSYINCAGAIQCQSYDDLQTVPVPGNDAANTIGEVTLPISYSFFLYPQINDPEDPSAAEPHTFVANLTTWTLAPGSETEAFNTVTLDRILIQPGAQISFASGHNWNVQVVPEPATWALWAFGLAGVAALKRRRRGGGLS